jgi:hypothetical protein
LPNIFQLFYLFLVLLLICAHYRPTENAKKSKKWTRHYGTFYNPSYLGGRAREDGISRPAQAES